MTHNAANSVSNLRHFRAIIAVADLRSFSAAADKLSIVPSALTATINQFEENIGVKIFNRTTRWVELTEHGAEFVENARRIVSLVEKSLDELREVAGIGKGKVTIAGVPSMLAYLVLPILKKYKVNYPEIEFFLRQETAEVVENLVASGGVNFGLASRWGNNDELEYHLLTTDTYGAVVHADHPLAQKEKTTLAELASYDILTLAPENGVRTNLDEAFKERAPLAETKIECANSILLTLALLQDLGVAILPYLAASLPLSKGINFIPIEDLNIKRELYLITRKRYNLSPAAKSFADFVIAESKLISTQ